jgi:primosomal protein N' (replication factor Y)
VGRLVADVGRIVGEGSVAAAPGRAPVVVGTERDLAGVHSVDLSVLVDMDGLVYGSNYRAAEEALRIGARLAGATGGGSGRRMMVQTSDPDHPVVVALRRGDPTEFLVTELAERERMGYPPAGSVLVIEIRAEGLEEADREIREAAGSALVMGPAPHRNGRRWLIQAADLDPFRTRLRPLVRRWRDSGATIRVDADPIDL